MSRHHPVLAVLITLASLALGCSSDPASQDENLIASDGKEDNFFSNTAQEYLATATVPVELEPEYAEKTVDEREARARAIMEGRTQQIAWFLHVYLIDKESGEPGSTYGGLRAMVLDGSYESSALKADPENPLRYNFGFTVQVGGTKNLLDKIRANKKLPAGQNVFPLEMAKLSNWEVVGFSSSSYAAGEWSPANCNCTLETLNIKLEPIPPSNDAYLDYARFLEDGVMDISVHVGWDYWARYDITHSRELYRWLTNDLGFVSPATSYESYNRLSGPLTKKLRINDRDIEARVTIFRPDPCESWDEDGYAGTWQTAVNADKSAKKRSCPNWAWQDPKANANPTTDEGAANLMADLKESLRTRDAVLFLGHSGYQYGYALASWYRTSRGDLDPPEIRALDLPKDKSQLFVLAGCDTYHVADAFRNNPNKQGLANLDVITTTSFSNASSPSTTQDVLAALVGPTGANPYSAYSYGRVLANMNPSTTDWGSGMFTMYGVHGIDDNPLANPLGDASQTCHTCQIDGDCHAAGNVCVRLNDSEKVCAVQCLHDKGCTADQSCRQFGGSQTGTLRGMACVPKTLTCNSNPPPPTEKQFTTSGDVARGENLTFSVAVGATAKNIQVVMKGTGDADLYTQFGSAPTLASYSCRPYKNGSQETCSHGKATASTLEILVNGYAAQSHFELKVTWQ